MERKTKEQIFEPEAFTMYGEYLIPKESALRLAQFYADQEMAAFAEWISRKGYERGIGTGTWSAFKSTERLTTQQLITKFKEQNGK